MKAEAVNVVIHNSNNMEHVPSVTSVRKLFTIIFNLRSLKINIVYFYINISNIIKSTINTYKYTAYEQDVIGVIALPIPLFLLEISFLIYTLFIYTHFFMEHNSSIKQGLHVNS